MQRTVLKAIGEQAGGDEDRFFRAGFASVPAGQIEAATSVGMAPFDTLLRVTLPGALIAAVPSIVNMLIVLSKETVVLSIITVPELMYQVQTMAAETFTAFDAIFAMAVLYWLLVETVSRLGARLDARWTRDRLRPRRRRNGSAAAAVVRLGDGHLDSPQGSVTHGGMLTRWRYCNRICRPFG